MKIGVLSDTHIPKRAKSLPMAVLNAFESVDHIIHAGDILSLDVIRLLEQIAPVTAVAGNADLPETKRMLGEKKILTCGGYRIGIYHGHGSGGTTLSRSIAAFQNESPDCIVFGHSHIPYCGYHGKILLFNPGSPTDKRRQKQFSCGILNIQETITATHIFFNVCR